MTSGLSALLRLAGRRFWRRFETAADDPDRAHLERWQRIGRRCAGSSHWQARWGQAGAPPLAELPLTEYADYQPAFDQAFETGRSPTTGDRVTFWTLSTGSTSNIPKRFPLNESFEQQSRSAWLTYAYSLARAAPRIPLKPLIMCAYGNLKSSPAGVPVGWVSGQLASKLSGWKSGLSAIPWAVTEQPELAEEWATTYAVANDASLGISITAGYFAHFHEKVIADIDRNWRYLEGSAKMPGSLPRLRVSRRRLRHLRSVFRKGPPSIGEIWPGMAAVVCWTGASAAASVPLLAPRLGGVSLVDGPYSSTETGLTTIPLYDGKEGHPLHPHANVVELLPENAAPDPRNVIPASQAEVGQRYELIVTTLTGLVRYRTHDIVECTGFYRRDSPTRIPFQDGVLPEDLLYIHTGGRNREAVAGPWIPPPERPHAGTGAVGTGGCSVSQGRGGPSGGRRDAGSCALRIEQRLFGRTAEGCASTHGDHRHTRFAPNVGAADSRAIQRQVRSSQSAGLTRGLVTLPLASADQTR